MKYLRVLLLPAALSLAAMPWGCSKSSPSSPMTPAAATPTPSPDPTPLPFKSSFASTSPYKVAVTPAGDYCFVSNFAGTSIVVYGPYGSAVTITAYNNISFSQLIGVAVDPTGGNLYAADYGSENLYEYSSLGGPVTSWDKYNGTNFAQLFGVAASPNGEVYTADLNNYQMEAFTASGVTVTKWNIPGRPNYVAVSPVSPYNVYVTDNSGVSVFAFTASGAPITQWGGMASLGGTGHGQFVQINALTVGPNGNVFVADGEGMCFGGGPPSPCSDDFIQEFNPQGAFLAQWGGTGSTSGKFSNPYGVAAAANGDIFVADTGNNRIQVFGP
jgi:hypothetical protein